MAEYLIMDNTDAEIAGVVDIDSYTTLPLVAVGSNRHDMLKAFVDRYGDVIEYVEPVDLQTAFLAFLRSTGVLPEEATTEADQDAVVYPPGVGDYVDAGLAQHEAAGTSDVPEPQPADTDMEADTSTETVDVQCFNCEGAGVLKFGDGSPDQQCNTCGGSGRLTMNAV